MQFAQVQSCKPETHHKDKMQIREAGLLRVIQQYGKFYRNLTTDHKMLCRIQKCTPMPSVANQAIEV